MASTLKKSLRELSQASTSLGVMQTNAFPIPLNNSEEAAAHRLFAFSGMDSTQLTRDSRDLDVIMTCAVGTTDNNNNYKPSPWIPYAPNYTATNTSNTQPPPPPPLQDVTNPQLNKKNPSDILQEEMDGFMDAAQKGKLQDFFDMKQSQLVDSILNQHREFSRQEEQNRQERRLLEESTAQIDEALYSSKLVPGRALSGISSSFKSHIQQQQKQQENGNRGFPARDRSPDALIWNEVSIYPTSNTTCITPTNTSSTSTTTTQGDNKYEMVGQVMTLEQEMKYISSQSTIMVSQHLELLLSLKEPPMGIPTLQDLSTMLEKYEDNMTGEWKKNKEESTQEKTTRNAYLNTIRLLQKMFYREIDLLNTNPGRSSYAYSTISKNDKILYRAMGALQYLGELFGGHVVNRVEKAATTIPVTRRPIVGQSENSFATMIKKYVELELGRDVVARGGNAVVYRCLYYCLRSGDACAANEILDNYLDVDPAVRNIILFMAKAQSSSDVSSSSSNVSGSIAFSNEPSIVPMALRNEISDQYRRLKTRLTSDNSSSSAQVDEYQLACFSLLSLEENLIAAGTKSIILSIEDYIYANLWWAVNSSSESQTSAEICQLGDNIKTWGAEYFEGAVGWSFALPLLLSQQFYSAMTHLASSADEGLLLATHLSLALTASGATITDTKIESDDSNIGFLRSIVFSYAEALQSITPSGALRYLVCISRDASSDSESVQTKSKSLYSRISKIILRSRCFEGLAGFINSDGSRMPSSGMGGLDKYFSKKEVSDILEFAAEETRRDGHVSDSAELLMLSERYVSLLVLLCRQLSSMVGMEVYNVEERQFWRSAAKTFYYVYLDKGRTYVVQTLENEGRISLKKSLYILLQLMDSFDFHRDGLWQACWDTIDKLEFFPRNESEMASKVSSFYALDGNIRDIFHGVISIGMEALYHQFMNLKASFAVESPAGSATQLHLSEIRLRVKLLVTFTGLIQFRDSNKTKMHINRMEVCIL